MYASVNSLGVLAAVVIASVLALYIFVPGSRPAIGQKIGVLNRGGVILYPLLLLWVHLTFLGRLPFDFSNNISWGCQALGIVVVLLSVNKMLDATNRSNVFAQFTTWLGDLFTLGDVSTTPAASSSRQVGTVTAGTIKALLFGVILIIYGSAVARALAALAA